MGAAGTTTAPAAAGQASPLFVGLHDGPSEQHPVLDAAAVTNEEAWRHGRLLRIGEAAYRVELNPPFVDRVELHARAFVGIPLVPAVQVCLEPLAVCTGDAALLMRGAGGISVAACPEPTACHAVELLGSTAVLPERAELRPSALTHCCCGCSSLCPRLAAMPSPFFCFLQLHFADEAACQWQWSRQRPGIASWEPVAGATSRRYWPTAEDAGCRLRVECTPARWSALDSSNGNGSSSPNGSSSGGGRQAELVLGVPLAGECGPVEVPPSPAACEPRHALTQQPTASPDLRVVTYNILADQYAGTDRAMDVIFAHCPNE